VHIGFKSGRLSTRRTVRQNWIASLPHEKHSLFEQITRNWEVCYVMLSISLDEGLGLRSHGSPVRARQCAANSAEFLQGLAAQLQAALTAMEGHGHHFGTLPSVAPLNSSFFRGETAQRGASWNSLLHRVLLSDRSRFFHKLRTLGGIVEELAEEFLEQVEELVEGSLAHPAAAWEALECLHYDLNTSLRETAVVLKSFLHALPDEELIAFHSKLEAAAQTSTLRRRRAPSRVPT
jgi:hypothetical protein